MPSKTQIKGIFSKLTSKFNTFFTLCKENFSKKIEQLMVSIRGYGDYYGNTTTFIANL